jgi:3-oxoacyl-[acyl-carrier protein] reductase
MNKEDAKSGSVVIVTGALGGIGREIVSGLVSEGYRVIGSLAEGVESATDARELSSAFGDSFACFPLDLAQPPSVKKFFDSAVMQWGKVDSLVNNAAVGSATVARYTADRDEQNQLLLRINAGGTLHLTLLYIEQLKRQWGENPERKLTSNKLISISSVGGGHQCVSWF